MEGKTSKKRRNVGSYMQIDDLILDDLRRVWQLQPQADGKMACSMLYRLRGFPNRVEMVIDQMARKQQAAASGGGRKKSSSERPNVAAITENQSAELAYTNNRNKVTHTDHDQSGGYLAQLKLDSYTIRSAFPLCNHHYILERLVEHMNSPNRVQIVATELTENPDYPKEFDRKMKNRKQANVYSLFNMKLDLEQFLIKYPDPAKEFTDENKVMSKSYKDHLIPHLLNTFTALKPDFICQMAKQCNYRLMATTKILRKQKESYQKWLESDIKMPILSGYSDKFLEKPRQSDALLPDEADEYFYNELLYMRNEQEIKDIIEAKKRDRKERMKLAREKHALVTCPCCYDDELLPEDLVPCEAGHGCCGSCVKRSAQIVIGDGKVMVNCLTADCKSSYSPATLRHLLPTNVVTNMLQRAEQDRLKAAGVKNVQNCPFCDFAVMITNKYDKIFRCKNPDCMRESCRMCGEISHIPLRCDEVMKTRQTEERRFVESRMSEAMLRTCWKCKKKFFKVEGCNCITCVCGAKMCYLCGMPGISLTHFSEVKGRDGKCLLYTDTVKLHDQESQRAAQQARQEIVRRNGTTGRKQDGKSSEVCVLL